MMTTDQPLKNRTVALPESRQLDLLAEMVTKRGGTVLRCPLISILDSPNTDAVSQWLDRAITDPFDDLIVLTGEGLRRLLAFAEREGRKDELIAALGAMRKICRGPKPERVLREIGLRTDIRAAAPTTEGIITTLETLDLSERRIAVQLYGEDPNQRLMDFLATRAIQPDVVAPYIYAPKSDEAQVVQLIGQLASNAIDVIAFTSQPQFKRLLKIARTHDCEAQLFQGLQQTCVAAVGPIVEQQLENAGIHVDVVPEDSFFMKPLVRSIIKKLQEQPAGNGQ